MNDLASDLVNATIDTYSDWQPGTRAAHTHGSGLVGYFQPSGALRDLTSSKLLAGPHKVPAIVRFSNGAGEPIRCDRQPGARGLAVKLAPGDANETDLVAMTLSSWFTRTPELFLDLARKAARQVPAHEPSWRERLQRAVRLQPPLPTLDPSVTVQRDPRQLSDFARDNPEARRAVASASRLVLPTSYARATYHGVNSFVFVRKGVRTHFRYTWQPIAGVKWMSDDQLKKLDPSGNWLHEELVKRLQSRPIEFVLRIQLADTGDAVDDPTKVWPRRRRRIIGGRLLLDQLVDDPDNDCERLHFNPGRLGKGIKPSDDKILLARIDAYQESGRRRGALGCPLDAD